MPYFSIVFTMNLKKLFGEIDLELQIFIIRQIMEGVCGKKSQCNTFFFFL